MIKYERYKELKMNNKRIEELSKKIKCFKKEYKGTNGIAILLMMCLIDNKMGDKKLLEELENMSELDVEKQVKKVAELLDKYDKEKCVIVNKKYVIYTIEKNDFQKLSKRFSKLQKISDNIYMNKGYLI